jgi:hypothetical protein
LNKINLILGDYYKTNSDITALVDHANEIIKWFNNHSFALGLLNGEQMSMFHKILALILPVVMRWTSHFCSLSRLLEISKALKVTAMKHEDKLLVAAGKGRRAKDKARKILDRISNDTFWKNLLRLKTHIEPLAIAVNVSQRSNTRCDQVLLLLGKLYRTYVNLRVTDHSLSLAGDENESHPVTSIIDSIKKRWERADQDLFIIALFLNPLINPNLINSRVLPPGVLMGIARRLYSRVFKHNDTEAPAGLIGQIYEYHCRTGIFAPAAWPIQELQNSLKDEVSFRDSKDLQ